MSKISFFFFFFFFKIQMEDSIIVLDNDSTIVLDSSDSELSSGSETNLPNNSMVSTYLFLKFLFVCFYSVIDVSLWDILLVKSSAISQYYEALFGSSGCFCRVSPAIFASMAWSIASEYMVLGLHYLAWSLKFLQPKQNFLILLVTVL